MDKIKLVYSSYSDDGESVKIKMVREVPSDITWEELYEDVFKPFIISMGYAGLEDSVIVKSEEGE